ncbi:hypothetical protein P7C70_g3645, partial [Phenoliferia sp. Uapishka_3]
MTIDDHVKRGHPIIFGVLAFFSFIEFVQTAVLVASCESYTSLLETSGAEDRGRDEGDNSSFWRILADNNHNDYPNDSFRDRLAGAAAITATLGGGLTCGDMPNFAHCHQLDSAEAFAWICWIISTVAFVMIVMVGARSARRGDGFGGAVVAV